MASGTGQSIRISQAKPTTFWVVTCPCGLSAHAQSREGAESLARQHAEKVGLPPGKVEIVP